MSNPALSDGERQHWVQLLMRARREMGDARLTQDMEAKKKARATVDEAKQALGERGPVWWDDGTPDYNRHLIRNTPYASWYEGLPQAKS